jgi:hypothetical protein
VSRMLTGAGGVRARGGGGGPFTTWGQNKNPAISLSPDGLSALTSLDSVSVESLASIAPGTAYWMEFLANSGAQLVGVAPSDDSHPNDAYLGNGGAGFIGGGSYFVFGSSGAWAGSWATGDRCALLADYTDPTRLMMTLYTPDGVPHGPIVTGIGSAGYNSSARFAVSLHGVGASITANFGQSAFVLTPPLGVGGLPA